MELSFEDVKVGQTIPPLVKQPTEIDVFLFSAVTWNPHRIHYDADFAREHESLPGVLVHRPLHGCYLEQMLTDWVGDRGRLKIISWANRGPAKAGDTLTCRGKVTDKHTEDGQNFIRCEIWVENDKGVVLTPGKAVVMLHKSK